MSDDFESPSHDGHHPFLDPGNDWRGGNGLTDIAKRFVSYGNWAGPGNRMETENADYIKQQQAGNAGYSPYDDPSLMNDPRYRAIDGIDAGARDHDRGYGEHLGNESMFSWNGIRNVREVDRKLVSDVQGEMDTNGDQYSGGARAYSQGLRGFFGGRVMGMDAADWAGSKAGEAKQGIGNFVSGARNWNSLGDAASGIGTGLRGAGSWLRNTGSEAWNGIRGAARDVNRSGPLGWAGAAAGLANVGAAGAWEGAKKLGGGVLNGGRKLMSWLTG